MSERKPQMHLEQPYLAESDEPLDLLAPEPIPEDADHPGRHREPTSMRALVELTLRRLQLPNQDLWREEMEKIWSAVVPPELASVIRPGKWEHGVLYLFVTSSARLFEIKRFHLPAIEAGLRRHWDATRLKQVRLMIDPG